MSGGNYNQQPGGYPPQPGMNPQQPYGQPQPYAAVQPHRGTAVLVLGILGLILCGILGIVAFVMGKNDLAEMAAGRMDRTGEGMTKVGYYLGMVAIILMILGVVIFVGVMALGIGAGAMQA